MSSDAELDAILMRFPGPVALYRSRRKWLLVLAGCVLFAIAGIGMIRDDAANGWWVLIFFGFGSLVAAVALLPGAGTLALQQDGFEIKNFFRRDRIAWQDATRFEPIRIPPAMQKLVAFDQGSTANRPLAKLNIMFAGHNGVLPDTYGLSAEALARLMTLWRERALASKA
jgi:hypothetical protein